MALVNPCCCITLRTGAKMVAVVDIIVALVLLIIFISDLALNIDEQYGNSANVLEVEPTQAQPLNQKQDEDDSDCEEDHDHLSVAAHGAYVTTGVWTILTVFLATNVGISALLYTGARNYSIRRCKWWFYIQTVITAISLFILILILCFRVAFVLVVFDIIIHLVYRMYTLWVVYLFIGELTYLDTLCHLNSHKKGNVAGVGGGIMYPNSTLYANSSSLGSTSPTSYDYYGHTNIYANTPYQQQHPQYQEDLAATHAQSGHITATIGGTNSPIPHYNSSDDGLPPNTATVAAAAGKEGDGIRGGIDNPSYLP